MASGKPGSQSTVEMPARYDFRPVEEKWYRVWLDRHYFHVVPDGRQPYTIMMPPPNITSVLHMGQALNDTIQDILIRWKRMQGYNTLWMPGIDHAGIATQNVVERQLAQRGISRHDLGRRKFAQELWKWKEEYGNTIIEQVKRLGCSCDWERQRFTMDEGLSRAVVRAFVTLHAKGLIYKGKYIINWCPRCTTALSDDEVDHVEHEGHLWYISYPFADGSAGIAVATTRPETMLGDVAVAVHPDDERYRELVGRRVILPIMNREIPVIADAHVDRDFGTGAVKVTPAHDPNDFEIGTRHGLEPLNVMNDDATMNEAAGSYAGMDRFACREKVLEELRRLGLIEKIQKHLYSVGHCYRCETMVEPRLSDQWFVRMKPLAEQAIQASREDRVRLFPERWTKVYVSWLENVRDWCISRQIWWGHQIPAWYCDDCGEITVSDTTPTGCGKCRSRKLRQDQDVLDTWFSSALWPFSTLGWPDETPELRYYYPTSTLVTAREIIYFWVARMVMMGLTMMGDIPFGDVYLHATVLDEKGAKMSKSAGNAIDPRDIIDRDGADSLRLSLVLLTSEAQGAKLAETKFEMGRNFSNKLWNASRFVITNLAGKKRLDPEDPSSRAHLQFEDRWIMSRCEKAVCGVAEALEQYEFNRAANTIYDFVWHEFCDWYLEMLKPRICGAGSEGASAEAGRGVAHYVMKCQLRLLHPFMPFITEEIWQRLRDIDAAGLAESITTAPWPQAGTAWDAPDVEQEVALIQEVARAVRNIRNKMGIDSRKKVPLVISSSSDADLKPIRSQKRLLMSVAALTSLDEGIGLSRPGEAATEVVGRLDLFVPLKGLLDVQAECRRLEDRTKKVESQLAQARQKLGDSDFLERAPAEIIERQRERATELEGTLAKLRESRSALGDLR